VNEPTVDRDEQILSDELPDVALEVAAGKYGEVENPFTIAFCSGLDTVSCMKNCGVDSARTGPAFHNRAQLIARTTQMQLFNFSSYESS
jgi:hypothetical protein